MTVPFQIHTQDGRVLTVSTEVGNDQLARVVVLEDHPHEPEPIEPEDYEP